MCLYIFLIVPRTTKHTEQNVFSQEDAAIIENLDLLDNLELLEDDPAFLQEYDQMDTSHVTGDSNE